VYKIEPESKEMGPTVQPSNPIRKERQKWRTGDEARWETGPDKRNVGVPELIPNYGQAGGAPVRMDGGGHHK
jgi:hypothetical protein